MPDILIYSDIGENYWEPEKSLTGAAIKSQLEGDVTVRINSPGGDVFEGFAIYNLLKQHEGKVTVYIDGLAASAASIIAMAGDIVHMPETAMMMIHDPWTIAVGDAADMQKTAELLSAIKDSIVPAYTEKTGMPADEVAAMMAAETWLTGAQAISMGFASDIEGKADVAPKDFKKPWINNAPKVEEIEPTEEEETPDSLWRVSLAKKRLTLTE